MRTQRDILSNLRQQNGSLLRQLTDQLMGYFELYTQRGTGFSDHDKSELKRAVLRKLIGSMTNVEDAGYRLLEQALKHDPGLQAEFSKVAEYQTCVGDMWRSYNYAKGGVGPSKSGSEERLRDWLTKHAEDLEVTTKDELTQKVEDEVVRITGLIDPNSEHRNRRR